MNMKFLDVHNDYGACLWHNGRAIEPSSLDISDELCQRINLWLDRFSEVGLLYDEPSDNWWEEYINDKIEIVKSLQKELPDVTVRVFHYVGFVELEKWLYQIEIIDGFESGGNFWIAPTIQNESEDFGICFYVREHEKRNGITLDDTFSFPYIYFFLKPYFDFSIQGRKDSYLENGQVIRAEQGFYWWGNNYYAYENIRKMLGEIRGTIHLLINHFDSSRLNEWKAFIRDEGFDYLFLSRFYPDLNWGSLSESEQNQFIKEHCYIFIDFYFRFIDKIELMMKNNPQYNLIYFAGP